MDGDCTNLGIGDTIKTMGKIHIDTLIRAPLERCFDLSRSVDLHMESAASTYERAVAGKTHGLMDLNDVVTWEAKHFGVTQRLTAKITAFNRPHHFRDSQLKGIFRRFDHDHFFETVNDSTLMKDVFDYECPLGILGVTVDFVIGLHLKKFLKTRNSVIKKIAEGEGWRSFI